MLKQYHEHHPTESCQAVLGLDACNVTIWGVDAGVQDRCGQDPEAALSGYQHEGAGAEKPGGTEHPAAARHRDRGAGQAAGAAGGRAQAAVAPCTGCSLLWLMLLQCLLRVMNQLQVFSGGEF